MPRSRKNSLSPSGQRQTPSYTNINQKVISPTSVTSPNINTTPAPAPALGQVFKESLAFGFGQGVGISAANRFMSNIFAPTQAISKENTNESKNMSTNNETHMFTNTNSFPTEFEKCMKEKNDKVICSYFYNDNQS